MGIRNNSMGKQMRRACVVHHSQKITSTQNASAEFGAIGAANKALSLLSRSAASGEILIPKKRVDVFAQAAGLTPKAQLISVRHACDDTLVTVAREQCVQNRHCAL
jgi:hypothetical protein